jgi:hypothetical protein
MPSPLTDLGAPRRSAIQASDRQLRDCQQLYSEAAELCHTLWEELCMFRKLRSEKAEHCRELRRMREATSERTAETRDLLASQQFRLK